MFEVRVSEEAVKVVNDVPTVCDLPEQVPGRGEGEKERVAPVLVRTAVAQHTPHATPQSTISQSRVRLSVSLLFPPVSSSLLLSPLRPFPLLFSPILSTSLYVSTCLFNVPQVSPGDLTRRVLHIVTKDNRTITEVAEREGVHHVVTFRSEPFPLP